MKRRMFVILALAALILALACGAALADESGSCGDNVTYSFNSATGTLTVSGTGAMADYDMSGNLSPFARNAEIRTVNVNEGVTAIGYAAFYGCSGITEVSLPESLRVIGGQAFRSCSALNHITLPNGLESIGTGAFSFCRGLISVILPDSLTIIDTGVFINCSGLTSVSIPGSVVSVGGGAFTGCANLTSATFNNSGTVIGADAFANANENLTLYGWDPSTAKDYADAHSGTVSFESLGALSGTCGDDVTYSFDPATGTLAISGTGPMRDYIGESGVPWYKYKSYIHSVTVENGITEIGVNAFLDCTALTSVIIPNSVTCISNSVFRGCTGLTGITIPNSVTYIDEYAFSGSGLTSITIPNSVTIIYYNAFRNCTGLTNVTIPSSVATIGYTAFSGCTNLTSVTILNPNCDIGYSVFYDVFEGCASGFTLYGWAGSTAETYAGNTVNPCFFRSLGSLSGTCGDDVTYSFDPATGTLAISGMGPMRDYIGESGVPWYKYKSYIHSVTVENGITEIGVNAFLDCTALTSVIIPNSVTCISNSVFRGCTSLTGVTIPNSVTYIDEYAFSGSGLTSITIPNSVTIIYYNAFRNCTGLTSVTIPSNVATIGYTAFSGCTNLTSVTILNPNCDIGYSVFYDVFEGCASGFTLYGWAGSTAETYAGNTVNPCFFRSLGSLSGSCGENATYSFDPATGALAISGKGRMAHFINASDSPWYSFRSYIRSVTIANGIINIGYYAFYNCTGLTSVTIPDSVTPIFYYAFEGCSSLTDVTIPNSVTEIGYLAFKNCTSLTSVTILNPDCIIGDNDLDVFQGCPASLVLHGWEGSTTEAYAQAAGISFESMGSTDVSGICGDSVSWNFNFATGTLTISGTGAMANYSAASSVPWHSYRSGILSATVEKGVTRIDNYAFTDCTGLTGVTIANPDCTIGDGILNVFAGCPATLVIHGWEDSTAEAYAQAMGITFGGWATAGSCGANVTWAFHYATGTLTVSGTGAMTNYSTGVSPWYNYRNDILSVTISNGVTLVGDYAFRECPNMTSVTIPNSVTRIGFRPFYDCTSLTSVTIPASVAIINSYAFQSCTGLTSVTILNPNCDIGGSDYDVFTDCPDTLTLYGYASSTAEAYAQAAGINFTALAVPAPTFTLPAALTTIEADAFRGIAAEAVLIPASVISISGNPFAGSSVHYIYGSTDLVRNFAQAYGYVFVPIGD